MADEMREFRKLAGIGPLFEDRRLTEKTKIDVKGLVKSAMKVLGVSGTPVHSEDAFSQTLAVPGRPSPFTAVFDASPQTDYELLWFEIAPDSYEAVKGMLPPHTTKKDRSGMLMAHPKGSFSARGY